MNKDIPQSAEEAIQMYVDVADDQQKCIDNLRAELSSLRAERDGLLRAKATAGEGEKERAVAFGYFLSCDYDVVEMEDGSLGWWGGKGRKYTTSEMYDLFIQQTTKP